MDDLFNILSSSARIDKRKRKRLTRQSPTSSTNDAVGNFNENSRNEPLIGSHTDSQQDIPPETLTSKNDENDDETELKSRDRTGKRDLSASKLAQVHCEQVSAFRRSLRIQLGKRNRNDDVGDPLTSFSELSLPSWWMESPKERQVFQAVRRAVLHNIESQEKWKEPTPIQMQAIASLLMQRRDLIGAAPTGSGKSAAFLIPAIFLASASVESFYGTKIAVEKGKKHRQSKHKKHVPVGEIRTLIVAPSTELAAQLHRQVECLAMGKPGGVHAKLLTKANASTIGDTTLDVLVATPLRLIHAIEQKGFDLGAVRLIVLDEADRLLDATDGKSSSKTKGKNLDIYDHVASSDDEEEREAISTMPQAVSGSSQSQSFLSQMDTILHQIPATAIRALFSATVTSTVRQLSESILRNPVDVTIAATSAGGANPDIDQKLVFVGREQGKLLAIRQMVARGDLQPPAILFVSSQERAQALFAELLYDKLRVDVLHAGRSRASREAAVARFRRGDTWLLIGTDVCARGVDFRAVRTVINYDLPASGVTYVHRIGRTGRAGRKGQAISFFTENDFDNLRTIANVMKQSGCEVADWMLNLKKIKNQGQRNQTSHHSHQKRCSIDTTPSYDKKKRFQKAQMIQHSKLKNNNKN